MLYHSYKNLYGDSLWQVYKEQLYLRSFKYYDYYIRFQTIKALYDTELIWSI